MIEAIQRLTEDMRGKIRLMVGRAILSAVQDGGAIQTAQASLLADEAHDDMERVQQYGFTSVPMQGAEAVVVFPGGNRDHGLIIAVDDRRYRLRGLESGEVALYTDEGDSLVLKRGNTIEITTEVLLVKASQKARFETPLLETTGEIKDRCDADGRTMEGMRTTYNIHTHNETNTVTNVPNQQL